MILRTSIIVPEPAAYIIGARRIPDEWHACSVSNLGRFVSDHPGWEYYATGGIRSSWLGGANMIREAEVCCW